MSATLVPQIKCQKCGAPIELKGLAVGDSTRCSGCNHFEVITRTKVSQGSGGLPAARRAGLSAEERLQVNETLQRIKLRRVGHAARHVELYPSWAIMLSAGQFWLSSLLAGENLRAMGEDTRGRRLQILGVVAYLILGAIYVGLGLSVGASIPPAAGVLALVAPPIAFAAWSYWLQHAACSAARDAGAKDAGVLLPLLLGLILAIAQAFAVWFLWHTISQNRF